MPCLSCLKPRGFASTLWSTARAAPGDSERPLVTRSSFYLRVNCAILAARGTETTRLGPVRPESRSGTAVVRRGPPGHSAPRSVAAAGPDAVS